MLSSAKELLPDNIRDLEQELKNTIRAQIKQLKKITYAQLDQIGPNEVQWDFITSTEPEVVLPGPNQAGGKTTALAMWITFHATGRYPDDWIGPRYNRPIIGAVGGRTGQTTRDNLTDELLGNWRRRGSGFIPFEDFDFTEGQIEDTEDIETIGGGVPHQVDTFRCKHYDKNGDFDGWSEFVVFSYKAGAQRLEGYTLDIIACDEAPPEDVYNELSARLNFTDGYFRCAMNPQEGSEWLYEEFEDTIEKGDETRRLIPYDIKDCTHLGAEHIARLEKKYEFRTDAEARLHGRPMRGEGVVIKVPDEMYCCDPLLLSPEYPRIIGVDIPHTPTGTFAAALMVIDPSPGRWSNCYLTRVIQMQGQHMGVYANELLRMGGRQIPIAWPSDMGLTTHTGSGIEAWVRIFRDDYGLNMLPDVAHQEGYEGKKKKKIISTLGFVHELVDEMVTGRFKCVRGDTDIFLRQKRRWRLKNGRVKERQEDHGVDAVLKGFVMRRYASGGQPEYLPGDQPVSPETAVGMLMSRNFYSRRKGRP